MFTRKSIYLLKQSCCIEYFNTEDLNIFKYKLRSANIARKYEVLRTPSVAIFYCKLKNITTPTKVTLTLSSHTQAHMRFLECSL